MVVDVLLCMLFPILVTHLAPYWEAFKGWLSKVRSCVTSTCAAIAVASSTHGAALHCTAASSHCTRVGQFVITPTMQACWDIEIADCSQLTLYEPSQPSHAR